MRDVDYDRLLDAEQSSSLAADQVRAELQGRVYDCPHCGRLAWQQADGGFRFYQPEAFGPIETTGDAPVARLGTARRVLAGLAAVVFLSIAIDLATSQSVLRLLLAVILAIFAVAAVLAAIRGRTSRVYP